MYHHQTNLTKVSATPYIILVFLVGILLLSAWFSTIHRRTFQDLASRQEQEQLESEISELKISITELTAVGHVHQLAKQLRMVQSAKAPIIFYTPDGQY